MSPLHHPHLLNHRHHQPLHTQALPIHSPISHNLNFKLAKSPHHPSSSPAQGIPYPFASSGGGFNTKDVRSLSVSDQSITADSDCNNQQNYKDEESIEHLSSQDLMKRQVIHARKVPARVTTPKPFSLRTEERGTVKQEKFKMKVQRLFKMEAEQRVFIACPVPSTTYEREHLTKPPPRKITSPADLKLHSDIRAVKRAEYDIEAKMKEHKLALAELLTQTLPVIKKAGSFCSIDIVEENRSTVKNKIPLVRPLPLNGIAFCFEASKLASVCHRFGRFHDMGPWAVHSTLFFRSLPVSPPQLNYLIEKMRRFWSSWPHLVPHSRNSREFLDMGPQAVDVTVLFEILPVSLPGLSYVRGEMRRVWVSWPHLVPHSKNFRRFHDMGPRAVDVISFFYDSLPFGSLPGLSYVRGAMRRFWASWPHIIPHLMSSPDS